jgi:hypothetical protein
MFLISNNLYSKKTIKMKTIKNFLCALFLVLSFVSSAQDLAPVVQNVNKAKDVSELIQVRSQLERFIVAQPQQWLVGYYLAYVDVQLSFRVATKDEKLQYLTEAETYLSKISELKETDKSEIYTLKGFRLYALIASDPQSNGPKYSGEIMNNYGTALGLNPNNPRAVILSALFKNDMAKFMHQSNENFQKDVDKATTLFAEENSTLITPTWGKNWVDFALTKK